MTQPDRLADFSLAASTGQTLSLESFRGKVPMVLVFLNPGDEEGRALLEELDSRHREFGSKRTQILAVAKITARAARELADEKELTVPILADASGEMSRSHSVEGMAALLADDEGRVVERLDSLDAEEPGQVVDRLLSAVAGLGAGSNREET